IEAGYEVGDRIALLVAKIHGREAADWHVGHFTFRPGHMHELLHRGFCRVGTKLGLLADPVSTFASDSALSELVAQLDLELGAVKVTFPSCLRNEELPTFPPEAVGNFGRHKCRSREDE